MLSKVKIIKHASRTSFSQYNVFVKFAKFKLANCQPTLNELILCTAIECFVSFFKNFADVLGEKFKLSFFKLIGIA